MDDLASADANIHTTLLEVISEGIGGAILVYDKNDLIVFASQQVLGLLPVPKTFLAPGTRLRDFLGAVYDEGGRFTCETTGSRRAAGREDWIAEQIAALWKEKGETIERRGEDRWISLARRRLSSGYGLCVIRDVSEHKKREEKWRADIERVQVTEEVLDNLPFTVTVKDQNHTFVAINKAACRFHNRTPESVLGHKGEDFQPLELRERLAVINNHVLETGDLLQLPERLTRADGSESIVVANKFRIGKPGRYYVVTTMQDLTRFLTVSSSDGEIQPAMKWDDFISLSLRQDKVERFQSAAGAVSLANRKVLVVSDDRQMEKEALAALADLKVDMSSVSTAEELRLFLQLASEAEVRVDLVVLDARLSPLYAEIATAHGVPALNVDAGEVEEVLAAAVASCLGEGGEAARVVVEEGWEVVQEGKDETIDVLVAEDNEVNQIVFSQILESLGYRYAIAADGEQAVQLWEDHAPQLILMDITLPLQNGFEAAAAIRAREEGQGQRVPIIGVLPQAFDRDRQECFNSGMDDVILKPISPEALESVFNKFLAPGEQLAVRRS
jgi:PAS domain S-box-containing protein